VCCCVLHCVAACCRVLQCVLRVLAYIFPKNETASQMLANELDCGPCALIGADAVSTFVAVCCSLLQPIAVCCSVVKKAYML